MNQPQPTELTTPSLTITPAERARRKAAIDYARASVRLEGFVLDDPTEQLYRRYIDGDLTRPELDAAILELG